MNAFSDKQIDKAMFISPVVDMENLITNMMKWANVTENELRDKKTISTFTCFKVFITVSSI
jgi:uncharacterized protein